MDNNDRESCSKTKERGGGKEREKRHTDDKQKRVIVMMIIDLMVNDEMPGLAPPFSHLLALSFDFDFDFFSSFLSASGGIRP